MTGFLGTLGEWAVMGIQMAAEEINAAGGVMGRPLEVKSEDSINPDTASTKAQRMLERDGMERSEEHTSELQSLMRISYAVFCLKKKTAYSSLICNNIQALSSLCKFESINRSSY